MVKRWAIENLISLGNLTQRKSKNDLSYAAGLVQRTPVEKIVSVFGGFNNDCHADLKLFKNTWPFSMRGDSDW